jgi:hypothetical protein
MKTTKNLWLGAFAAGVSMWASACANNAPTVPSDNPGGRSEVSVTAPAATIGTTSAVVTLQPDLTADQPSVTVPEWDAVRFVNNSGRWASIQSYNCTEFDLLEIPAGYSRRTTYFRPAGKTCDYFAWDDNWSRQIFVGQVVVK